MNLREAQSIAKTAESALAADGWRVHTEESEISYEIVLQHPLIGRLDFSAKRESSASQFATRLTEALGTRREFQVVRARPAEIPHAETMRQVRVKAKIAGWDDADLRHVCELLLAIGALDEAEAAWIRASGPA